MKCKCNKLIFGIIAGLVMPLATSYLIYNMRYSGEYDFQKFVQGLRSLNVLGNLVSVSVLPNLAVFMLVITYDRLLIARGLVIATFFWLIVVLGVRFLL